MPNTNAYASYEIPGFMVGVVEANIDMSSESTYQFTPVTVVPATGSGLVGPAGLAPVSATGDQILGILQNNPALSSSPTAIAEAGTVMQSGISKAKVKQACTVGQKLMAAPTGGLQVCTAGNYAVAIALNAGAPGDIIPVLLTNMGKL